MFGRSKKTSEELELKQAEKAVAKSVAKTFIGVTTVAAIAVTVAPFVPAVVGTVAAVAVVGTAIKVGAKIKVAADRKKRK